MKVNETVKRETGYIAVCVLILSAVMESVFLISGFFDYTVILGNLLSAGAAILNFFLMGLTVQSAVDMEEKNARAKMRLSQTLRTFMIFAVAAVGVVLPCFNIITVLVPLFFPRIAIFLRTFSKKNQE